MSQSSWQVLLGFEYILANALSLPIAILGAVILSWISKLPADVRHGLRETLGQGYVASVTTGMMGGWLGFFVLGCCFYLDSRQSSGFLIIVASVVLAFVLWVICLAVSPWHPEKDLPHDILSLATVRKIFKNILALKCLIILMLATTLAFFLTLIYILKVSPSKGSSQAPTVSNTLTNVVYNRVAQDGLAESSVQHPDKRDLEAALGDGMDVHPQPMSTPQIEDARSAAEGAKMATMDGAV
ncbi:hypothetical protein CVT26_012237 [Gymnopilus dilepis]|uniref:Uncharacterized protein n=1 Tax=Gymnopilus dilepis TaxID=231916 RepID=A0A409YQ70_9AGAR|nr:hypothetical protein CVT26_012237 [Gymnopilus dilepis]